MATEKSALDKSFLADLSIGGFAESLTPQQRREIHIDTPLDDYLSESLEEGKQIVLTGNPGDGKTQHILKQQDNFSESEYFYLLDASEYEDYTELLDEWEEAYENETPGILAINDGPLYAMTTQHKRDYPFLDTVQKQLENQIVYSDEETPDIDFSEIVVIDLNNREFLVPPLLDEAIETTTEIAQRGHDHNGKCHIQHNAQKLKKSEIKENLKDLVLALSKIEEHITVRDLLNFLGFCMTGGHDKCYTDFGDNLKYYNLAFEGDGAIFDLLRKHFHSRELAHPFIDSKLWADAEQEINPRDIEEVRDEIESLYIEKKRRFLFEDEFMDLDYKSRSLYKNIDHAFRDHLQNPAVSREGRKENLLKLLNGYFVPGSSQQSDLRLWLSHRYRSKSSLALISRTKVAKRNLRLRTPRLHLQIRDSIEYRPDHTVLEYTKGEETIRLRINQGLYQALSALDANVPYTLRSRDEEQQILDFMEEIEYWESYSEEQGEVSIKDTETGKLHTIDVSDEVYRV